MFTVSSSTFTRDLTLSKRVSNDYFTNDYVRYFDNDGFELSFLEQEYYREHRIPLSNILNHYCNQEQWLVGGDSNFIIDHSMLLQRFCFTGEAAEQLRKYVDVFPQLNKYIKLQPKWGLDFAIEYYHNNTTMEVLHFELDYNNFYEAVAAKEHLQKKIQDTNWSDFVNVLLNNRSKWEGLQGMAQNDWKAMKWGLNKAEKILKAFA